MDSILLVASMVSFFVLLLAWFALPASNVSEEPTRVTMPRATAAEA